MSENIRDFSWAIVEALHKTSLQNKDGSFLSSKEAHASGGHPAPHGGRPAAYGGHGFLGWRTQYYFNRKRYV